MTLQDDIALLNRLLLSLSCMPEDIAALARVRERLAKLETVASAARIVQENDEWYHLGRALAALDEDETPPQICVCRPDETYCGAWDCRHKPLAAGSGK